MLTQNSGVKVIAHGCCWVFSCCPTLYLWIHLLTYSFIHTNVVHQVEAGIREIMSQSTWSITPPPYRHTQCGDTGVPHLGKDVSPRQHLSGVLMNGEITSDIPFCGKKKLTVRLTA